MENVIKNISSKTSCESTTKSPNVNVPVPESSNSEINAPANKKIKISKEDKSPPVIAPPVTNASGSDVVDARLASVPSTSGSSGTSTVQVNKIIVQPVVEKAIIPVSNMETNEVEDDPIKTRSILLANFVIDNVTGATKIDPRDKVEETLLRCVMDMLKKYEIILQSMSNKLNISTETGYSTFVSIANELFENESKVFTWSRIIALYAFSAQLALHCKVKKYDAYLKLIAGYVGKYIGEVALPFIREQGGWEKLPEEFPSGHELGDNMWNVLKWTAVGLSLATATLFFTK